MHPQYTNGQQEQPNLLVCIPWVDCSSPMLCFLDVVCNESFSAYTCDPSKPSQFFVR